MDWEQAADSPPGDGGHDEGLGARLGLLAPVSASAALLILPSIATGTGGHPALLGGLAAFLLVLAWVLWRIDLSWVPLRYLRLLLASAPFTIWLLAVLSDPLAPTPSFTLMVAVAAFALVFGTFGVFVTALSGGLLLTVMQWLDHGLAAASAGVCVTAVCLVAGTAIAKLQSTNGEVIRVTAQAAATAARAQADAVAEREAAERLRAADAAKALEERERQVAVLTERIERLTGSSESLREQTQSISEAAEQMSSAMREISHGAQTSGAVAERVMEQARRANELMEHLAASSAEILAASDVIQAIAAQTNLLALNATIESARAGEAGRGFAVVANEVKGLAQQAGSNADRIGKTVDQVSAQVTDSVSSVASIVDSMTELATQQTSLAVALDQQSVTVATIVESVMTSAAATGAIADDVAALRALGEG